MGNKEQNGPQRSHLASIKKAKKCSMTSQCLHKSNDGTIETKTQQLLSKLGRNGS